VKGKTSRIPKQDRTKEIQRLITFARKRAAFGRQYATETGAYELADMIKSLPTLPIDPSKPDSLDQRLRTRIARTAHYLLKTATISTNSLRLVADALDAIDADVGGSPSQDHIITAYEQAYEKSGKRAPTFPEVRKTFVTMFGEVCWRGSDYSVRKTLKSLELPLTGAKRGRPPDAGPKKRRPRWARYVKPYAVLKR
jgi:hypothetical protein